MLAEGGVWWSGQLQCDAQILQSAQSCVFDVLMTICVPIVPTAVRTCTVEVMVPWDCNDDQLCSMLQVELLMLLPAFSLRFQSLQTQLTILHHLISPGRVGSPCFL